MEDVLTESGTFVHGMLHDGRYHTSFLLQEEVMLHTLAVANDSTIDRRRIMGDDKADPPVPADDGYYSACLLAKRLTVDGIPRVTPEMVERLSRVDGQILLLKSGMLDDRREEFRKAAQTSPEGHHPDAQAGVQGGGDPPHEQG